MDNIVRVLQLLLVASGLIVVTYLIWRAYSLIVAWPSEHAWLINNYELADDDMTALADGAQKYFYVVAGGAREFWQRPGVDKALRAASRRLGAENIVFVTDDSLEGGDDNPLVGLERDGIITLHRSGHDLVRHFRIADGKHYTMEWPHRRGAATRYFKAIRNNERGCREVLGEFRNIVESD